MPERLEIDGRSPISYDSAHEEEYNVINRLSYLPAIHKLCDDLWAQRNSIAALVKHHLRLRSQDTCSVLPTDQWIRGGFNLCVLVQVMSSGVSRKLVFRCPMPHKVKGIVDEKLSCEVGAYVWMQENCPAIRIPHLFGFGFTDGRSFTHAKCRPFHIRVRRVFWRFIRNFLQLPLLSQYTYHPATDKTHYAYTLLEYIGPETGEMLQNTWEKQRSDPAQRRRLFRGMAKIVLSLARIPQPKIGSFQFNYDGTITLSNRALSCSIAILENDGAKRVMQKNDTYNCTDSFVSDMITFHDNRFLNQPNAINNENDCRGQMTVKALLRVIAPRYIQRDYRCGPFLLQLTDFSQGNIFVDRDWNITCLIDLEWICALPVEMLNVPYWLTGCAIDEIQGSHYNEYDEVRQEFIRILEEEEQTIIATHKISVSRNMNKMWETKGMWFWHCISSVNAMYYLLETHLCPLSTAAEKVISNFWDKNAGEVVEKKLADRSKYDEELKACFVSAGSCHDRPNVP